MTWPPPDPTVAAPEDAKPPTPSDRRRVLRDVLWVFVLMVAAGVLAGVVWSQVVDPVTASLTDLGIYKSEAQLGKRVDADGWFVVIGFATSLLLGAALMAWRRTDEVLTLLAVVALSLLAAWLCAHVGARLGPAPASETLAGGHIGDKAADQISVSATVAYVAWPFGAVVGALLVLFGLRSSDRSAPPSVVQ